MAALGGTPFDIELDTESIIDGLKGEFILETQDRLDSLEAVLEAYRGGTRSAAKTMEKILREAHSIKGLGGAFGFPSISVLGHRIEDYLRDVSGLSEDHIRDCYLYLDCLREIIDQGEDPGQELLEIIKNKLPSRWTPTEGMDPNGLEALVAIPAKVIRMAVEQELSALGYRVITAQTGPDALQLAISVRPHTVVLAAVLPGLWGTDVAQALCAMKATSNMRIGLLTTLDNDRIHNLPTSVILIDETAQGLSVGLAKIIRDMEAKAT